MPAASDTASLGASQASTGKAKARELGEKTFSDFKQRRLSFRRKSELSASKSGKSAAAESLVSTSQTSNSSLWSSVKQVVRSHMDRSTKTPPKGHDYIDDNCGAALDSSPAPTEQSQSFCTGAFTLQPPRVGVDGTATPVLALRAAPPNLALRAAMPDQADSGRRASDASSVASVNSAIPCGLCTAAMSQHNALFEEQHKGEAPCSGMAGVQSNPLFDDASMRLTPREGFAAMATEGPPAQHAAAVFPPEAAAQLPHNSAGAPKQLPEMPAVALVAAAAEAAAAGQLQGVNEASSGLIAYAPGGLSVLYENQAMRVERVELKAELRLISARLAVLESRSKAWSRTMPAAHKGRSQSAPRGAPRHRQAPQRSAPVIAECPEQGSTCQPTVTGSLRGRSLQRAGSLNAQTATADSRTAACRPQPTSQVAVRAARSVAGSRPGSPARPAVHVAFGSRANSRASSPVARRGTARAASCRSSPTRPAARLASASRPAGSAAKPGYNAVPFGSRVCSPVRGATAPRLAFGSRAGSPVQGRARSGFAAKSGAESGCPARIGASAGADGAAAAASAGPAAMPYRNAFMGSHNAAAPRRDRQRDASPASSQGSRASAGKGNAANQPPSHTGGVDSRAGTIDALFGPPPPRRSAGACPSSEERWAGPGGRLGRAPLQAAQVGMSASKTRTVIAVQSNKENDATSEGSGKLSRVALTAAKLGLTLDTAFKPRQVANKYQGSLG
ncbi:g3289 [Coccomyxa elongata]